MPAVFVRCAVTTLYRYAVSWFGNCLHGFETFHRVESALLSTFQNRFKSPQDSYPNAEQKRDYYKIPPFFTQPSHQRPRIIISNRSQLNQLLSPKYLLTLCTNPKPLPNPLLTSHPPPQKETSYAIALANPLDQICSLLRNSINSHLRMPAHQRRNNTSVHDTKIIHASYA